MRKFLRGPVAYFVAVFGVLSAVVTVLGWAIPDLRDWLGRHAGLGWTLLGVSVVLGATAYLWTDHLLAEYEAGRTRERTTVEDGNAAAMATKEQQLAALEAERDDLKARLYPSDHDQELFDAVIKQLPRESGTVPWLEETFNGKMWHRSQSGAIYSFNHYWGQRYFDDPQTNEAFRRLSLALGDFGNWLALEGGDEDMSDPDDPRMRILDGNHRLGGWPAFDEARRQAERLAKNVIQARTDFERIGRSRGLRMPLT